MPEIGLASRTSPVHTANYFAVGNSSECFSFIQDWVEKKVRRHMMRARKRKGFGWMRWSRQWLYETLKLFNGYRVRHVC